ncbi:hypothetical protein ACFV9P_28120 [Streptomyces sp. NPDC059892]|uniref:hypothetical protein n=1 Tax=Streptomyces sp. NPDC059892 TaxID=3346989 RepID=UPI00365C35C4
MDWLPGQRITAQRLRDNHPRPVSYDAITSNSSATTTTEIVALTSSPVTFRTGRAYRISLKCAVQTSVAADRVTVRLRKLNSGGAVYIEIPHLVIPAATPANQLAESSVVASNDTGTDISTALALTIVRNNGTGNVLIAGSGAAFVGHILIENYGASSDFPNSRAIT